MYQPEEIKDCVNGVDGAFLLENGAPVFSDIDFDVHRVCNIFYYLKMYLDENCRASRIYVIGHNRDAIFYLKDSYTLGVRISKNVNIHLLHRTVGKILNHSGIKIKNEPQREKTGKKVRFFLTE
ncbi:MAG: hypothetical protein HXS41_05910 [Theionarchaea archaeon]|nr:hypothetical protein [Theionarchaea archaeon]MBU7001084.1 hypothetical protein [Theionarchaea archaeon]MBU7020573.1 hypothetical protein [Theionarchaea archaeon]MBU7034222.1 hypothetical protein [Theionarchaea archaeon]MBU7039296.1 hypothetical protein [Theionarchaea archaeon]